VKHLPDDEAPEHRYHEENWHRWFLLFPVLGETEQLECHVKELSLCRPMSEQSRLKAREACYLNRVKVVGPAETSTRRYQNGYSRYLIGYSRVAVFMEAASYTVGRKCERAKEDSCRWRGWRNPDVPSARGQGTKGARNA